MTKQITINELETLLRDAEITRDSEEIGEFTAGQDRPEWDQVAVVFDGYGVSQHVSVDGLKFFAQTALNVPQIKPTEAEFNHNTDWDFITVESCDFEVIDEDGDELDLVDSIERVLNELDHEVKDWRLADWPELVPDTDPVETVPSALREDYPETASKNGLSAVVKLTYQGPGSGSDTESIRRTERVQYQRSRGRGEWLHLDGTNVVGLVFGWSPASTPKGDTPEIAKACSDDIYEYTIIRDDETNLKFDGWQLGHVSSRSDNSNGNWTDLTLYRTTGGNYVAETEGLTQWQGQRDRHAATVCASIADVIAAFGHGWLAKELYESVGIEDAEAVA